MNYENKLLLSLVNSLSEASKIRYLNQNLCLKEILNLHKLYSTKNLEFKYCSFKDYKCAFVDDFFYPLDLKKVAIPPFRIASTYDFPSPFIYNIGVLGSSKYAQEDINKYKNFGIELSKNNLGLILCNYNGISKQISKGYLEKNKAIYCLIPSGLNVFSSINNLIFLSPFEMDIKPTRITYNLNYGIYGSLIDVLVLFQCGLGDYCKDGITSIIDSGTNFYIHKSATINNKINEVSFSLFNDGCETINSIYDLYI